jgi:hypothetical protein
MQFLALPSPYKWSNVQRRFLVLRISGIQLRSEAEPFFVLFLFSFLNKCKGHPMTCLWRHSGEAEVQQQIIRSLDARTGWVVSTTPRPFYPSERPITLGMGLWMEYLTAGLDGHDKFRHHQVSMPDPSNP